MNVSISDVQAGMIVAEDIYSNSGIKLVAQGTKLTEQNISKLGIHQIQLIRITNGEEFLPADLKVLNRDEGDNAEQREHNLRKVLKGIPLFSDFSDEQYTFVINNSLRGVMAANTTVFRENDMGSTFYVILRGSIKIFMRGLNQEEKILSILKEGDSFGELSMIDGEPRSASAQTLEETELLQFSQDKFHELTTNNPKLLRAIMVELSRRLRNTNQQLNDMIFHDSRTRIVNNLVYLARRFGERAEHKLYVRMPIDRDELAQMSAVKREEIDAVILELEGRKILKMVSNSFELDLQYL